MASRAFSLLRSDLTLLIIFFVLAILAIFAIASLTALQRIDRVAADPACSVPTYRLSTFHLHQRYRLNQATNLFPLHKRHPS